MSDTIKVAVGVETVFRIVENTWPEGYITYGICSSLDQAVAMISANRPLFQDSIDKDELVIEEVPLDQLSIKPRAVGGEMLTDVEDVALNVYKPNGERIVPFGEQG